MKSRCPNELDAPQAMVWAKFTISAGSSKDARAAGPTVTRIGNWTKRPRKPWNGARGSRIRGKALARGHVTRLAPEESVP